MSNFSEVPPGSSPAGPIYKRTRGYLPHWQRPGGTYFVTFRLADSLPQSALDEIVGKRLTLERAKKSGRQLLPVERNEVARLSSARVEAFLDAGCGVCYLRRPDIAEVVVNALKHHNGKHYSLTAWCVMPNHVHVVFTPKAEQCLHEVVRSWKSYTGRKANQLLKRSGSFWQREYYDHLLRNEAEVNRAIDYVLDNPRRARLYGWKWVEGPPGWSPALPPLGSKPPVLVSNSSRN